MDTYTEKRRTSIGEEQENIRLIPHRNPRLLTWIIVVLLLTIAGIVVGYFTAIINFVLILEPSL